MNPAPLLFEQIEPALKQCAALNHENGFYRVADLLAEDVPGLEGETGFAIVWDYEAAAQWRGSLIRLNYFNLAPSAKTSVPSVAQPTS